jgi:ribosome-binding factor A
MSNRTLRVNELIQREISAILRQRYQAESVALTITEVRVAPDLRDARVFVSIIGDDEAVEQKLRWLRSRATDINHELSRRIVLKFLPRFSYVLDDSAIRGSRILRLLDEVEPATPPAEDKEEPQS